MPRGAGNNSSPSQCSEPGLPPDQADGPGGGDIYISEMAGVRKFGSARLASGVNGATNETRPSLSWDAETLLFGSTQHGKASRISIIPPAILDRLGSYKRVWHLCNTLL